MGRGFTLECKIVNGVGVIPAYIGPAQQNLTPEEQVRILKQGRMLLCCFDTAAYASSINRQTAEELHARPAVKDGREVPDVYETDILLPGNILIPAKLVHVVDSKIDLSIGMDLIGHGDFALSLRNGKPIMSFTVPHQSAIELA